MKILHSLSLLSALILTPACSEESSFKGNVATVKPEKKVTKSDDAIAAPEPVAKPEPKIKTIELKPSTTQAPLDMIWLVDNSGSMAEEVAQVRSNMEKFAASVSAKSDLRLTVVADSAKPDTGLKLDSAMLPKDYYQLDAFVGSWNSLAILAASVCDKALTEGTDKAVTKICGQAVTTQPFIYNNVGDTDGQAMVVAGALKDRIRPDAVKVLVFVTDDDAKGAVTSSNFFAVSGLDKTSTHVYGFAAIPGTKNCKTAAPSLSYEALAKETGGELFDICEKDWSQNFSKLTEKVLKLASNYFPVPTDTRTVKSVTLKGQVLSPSQYIYASGKLVILDKNLLTPEDVLTIEYEVN